MLSSKYSLNCCTCLIRFEFETWFEFELKTLEKINRKAIRNSLENRKANWAQVGPLSPACARACVLAPPLSLPLPSGPGLSTSFLSYARPLPSLPRLPHLLAHPQPPTHVPPPWTRPRPRDLCPPPHVLGPFEPHAPLAHFPPLTCALSSTLSPLSRYAHAIR
jgi:hypothetical protein